ncbi:DeoR/GlpR family DNA-binding transcription regulator [Vibrio owensii]|uniref:DeoR/GlpR family DNA-binding transcription regulator n=1 Tax=Vibrio owensii TaxID=696485 RepID=UPI0038CE62E3
MQQVKRTDVILEHVKKHTHATIQELVDITSSSSATIRRDVNKLAETGMVYRYRGGISYGRSLNRQPTTAEKQDENLLAKRLIGKAATRYIKDGMTVFLDAGTTSFEVAKCLVNRPDVTVFTTDLHIACYLSELATHNVIIAGGNIDNCSQSVVGHFCDALLNNIVPDICFCTCSAFDIEHGVTSPTLEKAMLKQKISELGKLNILMTDSSKFGLVGTHKIGPLSRYDVIITDDEIHDSVGDKLDELVIFERVKLSES